MDLRIRIEQARQGHDSRFYDYMGAGFVVFQALVDEFGVIWELDQFPCYKMHPFSASCETIVATLDIEGGGLLIEDRQDIQDYLLDIQVKEARANRA
jgi:hypothetical protein